MLQRAGSRCAPRGLPAAAARRPCQRAGAPSGVLGATRLPARRARSSLSVGPVGEDWAPLPPPPPAPVASWAVPGPPDSLPLFGSGPLRPPDLSLPLTALEGSQLDFIRVHAELVQLESDREGTRQAVADAHRALSETGLLKRPERLCRAALERLRGSALLADLPPQALDALSVLDAQLLACHGALLEDLPPSVFARWAAEPELLADAGRFGREVRGLLYGESRFPILSEVRGAELGDAGEELLRRSATRRQLVVERETERLAHREFLAKQEHLAEVSGSASSGLAKKVWLRWSTELAEAVSDLRGAVPNSHKGRGAKSMRQMLSEISLDAEVLAAITCQTVLNLLLMPNWRRRDAAQSERLPFVQSGSFVEHGDVQAPFVTAVVAVGEAVLLEEAFRGQAQAQGGARKVDDRAMIRLASRFMRNPGLEVSSNEDKVAMVVPIGSALLDVLVDIATVDVEHKNLSPQLLESLVARGTTIGTSPKVKLHAFAHSLQREGSKKSVGYLVLRSHAKAMMDFSEADLVNFLSPKHRPMLVEPRPWKPASDTPQGGYLLQKSPFIRTRDPGLTCLRWYSPDSVARVMDGLGRTPWKVNRRILEVMEEVVRLDLAIAEVPPNDDPVVGNWNSKADSARLQGATDEEMKVLRIQHQNLEKRKRELVSERPTFRLKMQVARDFVNAPHLHFPHNVDFRGRAYPVPPHLNHIGDDVSRGLLTFAEAKPLGKDGFFWLKVNLANLMGKNKIPFDERVAIVDGARDRILSVAENPLLQENIDFWANADDGPWQALACCFEIAEVWRTGEEESFLSHQPVHLDGSCNGLQHYAALGRDEWGGSAVNLTPSDRPQDVYTVVLNIVKQKVDKQCAIVLRPRITDDGEEEAEDEEEDEENEAEGEHGVPRKRKKKMKGETTAAVRKQCAQRCVELGVLQRKVVKQTIMTICYGVTTLGAKQQVLGQLHDMVGDKVDEKELKVLAAYLSKLVLSSIDDVFERAMKIKRWFDEISTILNKHQRPTNWFSPIGLACVQPYKKTKTISVLTRRQRLSLSEVGGPQVNKSKQRMGFPPNFIHSCDATHMMLVADACFGEGLTFAGVHDSFWTHACSAPRLNSIIREAFIELHGRPLLEELREDLRIHLGGIAEPPELPGQGSLDINGVRDSKYIFH